MISKVQKRSKEFKSSKEKSITTLFNKGVDVIKAAIFAFLWSATLWMDEKTESTKTLQTKFDTNVDCFSFIDWSKCEAIRDCD